MGKLRPWTAADQVTIGGGCWTRPRFSHTRSCFSLHQLPLPTPPTPFRPVSAQCNNHSHSSQLRELRGTAQMHPARRAAGSGAPAAATLPPPAAASTHWSRSGTWRRRSAASRLTAGSRTSSAASAGHFRSPAASGALGRGLDSCPAWRCSDNCFTWGGGRWRASAFSS